jgi:hypothetical protein
LWSKNRSQPIVANPIKFAGIRPLVAFGAVLSVLFVLIFPLGCICMANLILACDPLGIAPDHAPSAEQKSPKLGLYRKSTLFYVKNFLV